MKKVLIIDDDLIFSKMLQKNISIEADILNSFTNIIEADLKDYELILLDQNLPNILGSDLIAFFKNKDKKIIMITSNDVKNNELLCYKLGCDDYITKPINFEILNIKLNNHFNRTNKLCYADIMLNNFKINDDIKLSKNEYILLSYLVEHNNELIDKKILLKVLWDNDEFILDTAFNTMLMRLRKKLAKVSCVKIVTIKNKGILLK